MPSASLSISNCCFFYATSYFPDMKNLHALEEQEKLYEEKLKKRISAAFPHASSVEDNLQPGNKLYTFRCECYKDSGRAILIWYDIWLPKSQIKIVWGDLQDVRRFQRADQLAAYVGLTPSQYTSADKVRMGRITCVGKNSLRATLIQASWALIRKDGVMQEKYDRLKSRSGGKRAIVAVARTLMIRMRRMLLDNNPYVIGLVAAN